MTSTPVMRRAVTAAAVAGLAACGGVQSAGHAAPTQRTEPVTPSTAASATSPPPRPPAASGTVPVTRLPSPGNKPSSPVTSPAAARSIAAAGFRIGDHTVTHPHLTQLSDAAVRQEILGGAVR